MDERKSQHPLKRPLLPYLDAIACGEFPKRWDHHTKKLVPNDDWLLMEQALQSSEDRKSKTRQD